MKLARKLGTAVAMIAVCSTMIVPMAVKASEDSCKVHYFALDTPNVITEGAYSDHQYLYSVIENADGTEAPEYRTCRIDRLKYYYTKTCTNCGLRYDAEEVVIKYKHAHCGLGIQ